MSRYPPLTIKELKAIQEANKGNPEVKRLLWEIHRLHEVLFSFDIHLGSLRCDLSYLVMNARANCMALLDNEPSVRWKRVKEKKARRGDRRILNHYEPKPTDAESP